MNINLSGFAVVIGFLVFISIPLLVLVPLYMLAQRRLRMHRQLTGQTIVAEYEPPAGLTAGEAGYLYDTGAGQREYFATILDLEQRGIIRLSGNDGHIHIDGNTAPSAPLRAHETYILEHTDPSQELGTLFVDTQMGGFNGALRSSLVDRGLINGNLAVGYFKRVLTLSFLASAVFPTLVILGTVASSRSASVIASGILAALIFGLVCDIILFPGYLIVGLILTVISTRISGQYWVGTPALRKLWPELEGYRVYVKEAELGQLKFESEDSAAASQAHSLPYAVALGLMTDWRQRFDQPV